MRAWKARFRWNTLMLQRGVKHVSGSAGLQSVLWPRKEARKAREVMERTTGEGGYDRRRGSGDAPTSVDGLVRLDIPTGERDETLSEGEGEDELGADDTAREEAKSRSVSLPVKGRRGETRTTHRTLGVRPLKNARKPSFLMSSLMTVTPPTLDSKF